MLCRALGAASRPTDRRPELTQWGHIFQFGTRRASSERESQPPGLNRVLDYECRPASLESEAAGRGYCASGNLARRRPVPAHATSPGATRPAISRPKSRQANKPTGQRLTACLAVRIYHLKVPREPQESRARHASANKLVKLAEFSLFMPMWMIATTMTTMTTAEIKANLQTRAMLIVVNRRRSA